MSTAIPLAVEANSSQRSGSQLLLPGQLANGDPILSVICKRTYLIAAEEMCRRAEEDAPITPGDVPWDAPQNSSVRFESDYIPYKLATDVVLNGKAHAPDGNPCREMLVGIRIGDVVKQVAVFGDRLALHNAGQNPTFTDPQPFQEMDLCYERAYGGMDVFSDLNTVFTYPRNPYGRGFVVANTRAAVHHRPLPNLEEPQQLLTPERLCVIDYYKSWQNQPMPASFGWFTKTWLPRAALAGVMPGDRAVEQELRTAYEKLVPAEHKEAYKKTQLPDMDFRFFNGASQGLVVPYLQGGERIVTEYLTPEGLFAFDLPTERPTISIDIGEGPRLPTVELQTVMIHLEERRLDLVWRGAINYPGLDWVPYMKKLEIVIQ